MADAKVVKRLIADAVFPEMVKKGFYLSFEEKGETGFDFVATAKTEVQDGAIVNTWAGDAEERIKVFVVTGSMRMECWSFCEVTLLMRFSVECGISRISRM